MLSRESRGLFYQSIADEINATYLTLDMKILLVNCLSRILKLYDARFNLERFSSACWGDLW
jgi:hypothetical protein